MQRRADDSDPYGRIQEGVAEEVQFSVCSPITSEGKKMGSGKSWPPIEKYFSLDRGSNCFYLGKIFDGAQSSSMLT